MAPPTVSPAPLVVWVGGRVCAAKRERERERVCVLNSSARWAPPNLCFPDLRPLHTLYTCPGDIISNASAEELIKPVRKVQKRQKEAKYPKVKIKFFFLILPKSRKNIRHVGILVQFGMIFYV